MLSQDKQRDIVTEALRHLGREYDRVHFNCLTFVRLVYENVGLKLPPLRLNILPSQLTNPPVGFMLYLKHKTASKDRRFTHVAIVLDNCTCIHCSKFFGNAVVITEYEKLFEMYDLAMEQTGSG